MAGIKISELPEISSLNDDDIFPVVTDTGGGTLVTKKIKAKNIISNEVIYSIVLHQEETVTVKDGHLNLIIPSKYNGREVINVVAYLPGAASSSGNVVVRVRNITKSSDIASVTISSGSTIGTQSASHVLATNNVIRVDVTSAGTNAKGLQIYMEIQK